MRAPVDDERTGGLIDGYYTEFNIIEEDRECLERFLTSKNVGVREEALLALMFSTGPGGPKFIGYATDALILHILGVVEDNEAMYTGVSVLAELAKRNDPEAIRILRLLKKSDKWRARYSRG